MPSLQVKRTPEEVAKRAACTQLLLSRCVLESVDSPQNKMASQILKESLSKSGLIEYLTDRERTLLTKDFKSWDFQKDTYLAQARWESFGILLWALRIFREIPTCDQEFPKEDMFRATGVVPAYPHTIETFIEYFKSGQGSDANHFVNDIEFKNAIDVCEAWYWRARAQMVLDFKNSIENNESATSKVPVQLRNVMKHIDQAIELGSERAVSDGLIPNSVDGDFPVNGVAYKKLDEHRLRDISLIAESRMAAVGWLAGTHEWEYNRDDLKFINPLGSLWAPE